MTPCRHSGGGPINAQEGFPEAPTAATSPLAPDQQGAAGPRADREYPVEHGANYQVSLPYQAGPGP